MQFVVDGDEPAVDRDRRCLVVVVVPLEAEQLVAAHPGEGGEPERGEVPVSCSCAKELLELRGRPRLLFDLGDGAEPGRVGDEGHVAGNQSSADGVGERTPDHEVDLVHGLGCERRASVRRMEQSVVERLEVVISKPPDPDVSERRHDVSLDVPAVPVVGGRGQGDALAGQPAAVEKRAKGQSADLVVAALEIGCEVRGEPLGVGALCPGRVPAAPLAPGDRIGAFVVTAYQRLPFLPRSPSSQSSSRPATIASR